MNAKRMKYSTGKEDLVPAIQKHHDVRQTQYPYPYTTGTDETEMAVVTLRSQEVRAGAQKGIIDENGQAAGTLQQLEVGNSTVEVQGNGSHSVLQIVRSGIDGVNRENVVQNQRTKTAYCPHCNNGFTTTGSLMMHMRACGRQPTAVSLDDRQCKECGKVFKSLNYLKQHMNRHAGIKAIRCGRCCRRFFEQSKYLDHLVFHKRQDQLRAQAQELNEQHGGKPVVLKEYRCSFCTQNFTAVFYVGQVKRRYACDACRDKYTNEEEQRQQKRLGKAGLVCDRCGRKFVFEGFLQRHLPQCDQALTQLKQGARKRLSYNRF